MNQQLFESSVNLTGEDYRNALFDIINKIEDIKFLEFLYNMLLSFKKKWGI